jgi:hypothetical protein
MKRIILPCAVLTTTLGFAVPAQATLLTRTFVSSAGNDSNPCTIAQPCATFAHAYTLTAPNGIVAALDPGKYGPLTITAGITINGNGWAAITGPAGGNAISVSASGGVVTLTGLEIDGAAAGGNGINFTTSGKLSIRDCQIRNFAGDGIFFGPSDDSSLDVSNTVISDNGVNGVSIGPTGIGTIRAVLDHTELDNNINNGAVVSASGGIVQLTVSNSVSAHNGTGVRIGSNGIPLAASVTVQSSIIAGNNTGLHAIDFGDIYVSRSTISANNQGIANDTGTTVGFFDNVLIANLTEGSFTIEVPLK